MSRVLLFLLLIVATLGVRAQTYADGFETTIAPQFPQANGQFVMPAGTLNPRLAWFLGELAAGETTTPAEVNEHFDPSWLATNDVTTTINFINSVRTSYPNARITDPISHTPIRLTALIDTPGSGFPSGFLQFGTRYTAPARINLLGVSGFAGSVMYPVDQALTLEEAADKVLTLSTEGAVLVARARPGGTCDTLTQRNGSLQRATGSVFKTWLLGGVARGVMAGTLAPSENLTMTSAILAPGGVINLEPTGTVYPVGDLATLMQGISDNTATDMLLARVGRAPVETLVVNWGMPAAPAANPLLPFMGITQTFHLFRSFALTTAEDWPTLTEAQQVDFLQNQIVPLGNSFGSFFHAPLLTRVTWRASPLEICRAFAGLRYGTYSGSEAQRLVDRAMGASAAQPNVRAEWDRVWYKGGSLASSANGTHVLVHSWLLEDAGRDPYVVVVMSNSDGGGIDAFNVQSVAGRILQLAAALP
jgi:beta-lactamase class A